MTPEERKPVIRDIYDLSRIFISAVKDLSQAKQSLTQENISKKLLAVEELRNLMTLADRSSINPVISEDAEESQNRFDRLNEECDRLKNDIKQADIDLDMERDINKRTTLLLLSLSRSTENVACFPSIDKFSALIMENAGLAEKETALNDLKNNLLKTESGKIAGGTGKKTFLGGLLSLGKEDPLKQVKAAALMSLSDLRAIIGDSCSADLVTIEQRIHKSDNLTYLLSLRKNILVVLDKYAGGLEKEKETITSFLQEVGERLVELESRLVESSDTNKQYHEDDLKFSERITSDIKRVTTEIKKKSSIDDLRKFVFLELEKITRAISAKTNDYLVRMQQADMEREILKRDFEDIVGNLLEQNKTLSEQSRRDPLTDVFNRRVFDEHMEIEIERFQRYKTPFSVLFFDIDHFKKINDTYGHEAGDRALRGIAINTRKVLRKSDIFARYGGEKFAIILPEADLSQAAGVAEKLRGFIEQTDFDYKSDTVKITISIGVTGALESDKIPDDIFRRVDAHLYKAKNSGRNCVVSDND